jgi:di/tricarboxylate transporter
MILTRCISGEEMRRSLELQVLLAIAAALGVGRSLEVTGAAAAMGGWMVELSTPFGTFGLLAGVYLATMLLTELITNNAAAALVFPVALAAAEAAGIDVRAIAFTVMFAASASFATPIGYQTNLMVYGPGGYKFSDFIRVGVPLQLLLACVTVVTIYVLLVR